MSFPQRSLFVVVLTIQGQVVRSKVITNQWLRRIETYTFLRQLMPAGERNNHTSSNSVPHFKSLIKNISNLCW